MVSQSAQTGNPDKAPSKFQGWLTRLRPSHRASDKQPRTPTQPAKTRASTTKTDHDISSPSSKLKGGEATGSAPVEHVQTGHDSSLAKNDQLWLRAQMSPEICQDKRWPKFAQTFNATLATPTVNDIIQGFKQATSQEPSQIRELLYGAVDVAQNFKDVGASLAAIDLTQHAAAAWGILQFLVTAAVKAKDTYGLARQHTAIEALKERMAIFARLYINSSVISASTQASVANQLEFLYVKVLRYVMVAWTYIQAGSLSHAFYSLVPFNSVKLAFDQVLQAEQAVKLALEPGHAEVAFVTHENTSEIVEKLKPLEDSFDKVETLYRDNLERQRHDVLSWLSDIKQGQRLDKLLSDHMPQTGAMIFKHKHFLTWQASLDSPHLMLRGKNGSGKSTLVALAVMGQLDQASNDSNICAYYFCDKTSVATQQQMSNAANIFRCLLRQILEKSDAAYLVGLASLYKDREQSGRTLALDETIDLLRQCCEGLKEITLIIDALDECPLDTRTALLDGLLALQQQSAKAFRTLTSSCYDHGMQQSISQLGPQLLIEVENATDLNLYIERRVNRLVEQSTARGFLSLQVGEINKELVYKCDGNFRYAVCAFNYLSKRDFASDLLLHVHDLPPELEDLYQKIHDELQKNKANDYETFTKVIHLLLFQRMALTENEFAEAILGPNRLRHMERPRSYILQLCAGFVQFSESTQRYYFEHSSVGDFFQGHPGFGFDDGHAALSLLCVERLREFFEGYKNWKQGTFICYAICQWPWHTAQASTCSSSTINAIETVLKQAREAVSGKSNPSEFSSWIFAARAMLLSRQSKAKSSNTGGRNGSKASVEVVVGSIDTDDTTSSSMHSAIMTLNGIAQAKLDQGSNISDLDIDGQTEDEQAKLAIQSATAPAEDLLEIEFPQTRLSRSSSLDSLLSTSSHSSRSSSKRRARAHSRRNSTASNPVKPSKVSKSLSQNRRHGAFRGKSGDEEEAKGIPERTSSSPNLSSTFAKRFSPRKSQNNPTDQQSDVNSEGCGQRSAKGFETEYVGLNNVTSWLPANAKINALESSKELLFSYNEWERSFTMITSSPSNPLFAAFHWGFDFLVETMDPKEKEAWQQLNLKKLPPLVMLLQRFPKLQAFCSHVVKACPNDATRAKSETGLTALHVVCDTQSTSHSGLSDEHLLELAQLLVEKSADVNAETLSGETPLHFAVRSGNALLTSYLLAMGALISVENPTSYNPFWSSIASVFRDGEAADVRRMLQVVRVLREQEPALLNGSVSGYSLAHVAAAYDNEILTKELIKSGIDFNLKAKSAHGATALHIAVNGPPTRLPAWLLSNGAKVDELDNLGRTPLHCAMSQLCVYQLLDHRAKGYTRDKFGRTPPEAAVARGASEALHALLSYNIWPSIWPPKWRKGTLVTFDFNISAQSALVLSVHELFSCVSVAVKRPTNLAIDFEKLRLEISDTGEGRTLEETEFLPIPRSELEMESDEVPEDINDEEDSMRNTRLEEDDELWQTYSRDIRREFETRKTAEAMSNALHILTLPDDGNRLTLSDPAPKHTEHDKLIIVVNQFFNKAANLILMFRTGLNPTFLRPKPDNNEEWIQSKWFQLFTPNSSELFDLGVLPGVDDFDSSSVPSDLTIVIRTAQHPSHDYSRCELERWTISLKDRQYWMQLEDRRYWADEHSPKATSISAAQSYKHSIIVLRTLYTYLCLFPLTHRHKWLERDAGLTYRFEVGAVHEPSSASNDVYDFGVVATAIGRLCIRRELLGSVGPEGA